MSCEWTEAFLEEKYEEALEFGLSEVEAAVYALSLIHISEPTRPY